MISIELGELYGTKDINEMLEIINYMRKIGMSDEEIQKVIDQSEVKE